MDYSTMSANSLFGNSTFATSTGPANGTPDKGKEKKFYDWHSKQGISAPQDYPNFASQPAPFSVIPQVPPQPTAASPYLHKMSTHQVVSLNDDPSDQNSIFGSDMPEGRRKPTLKRTGSQNSPPIPAGTWPKSMFGSRPPTRTRARAPSQAEIGLDHAATESNLPPLASIYDDLPFDPTPAETKISDPALTPTQVRVAGFSEERFPDLVRSLRRYYGQILEPYSGLSLSESRFADPDIYPRDKLDAKTLRMIQPLTGSDGGPGSWVRITFCTREAAERAVEGSAKGELVVGGRKIVITMWDTDPVVSDAPPFTPMDVDKPMGLAASQRRNSTSSASIRRNSIGEAPASYDAMFSEHVPGAKLVQPKQVKFAQKEGWLSSWTNSLLGVGTKATTGGSSGGGGGWGQTIGGTYRYIMDDVVGFKHL